MYSPSQVAVISPIASQAQMTYKINVGSTRGPYRLRGNVCTQMKEAAGALSIPEGSK